MDINNADAMAHLCRSIFDRWGKVDFWAHTAVHAAPIGPTATMDEKDWEKSIQLNVKTTGILIPYVTPLLGANGWAMFFDDTHAGEKFFGAYGASKSAQIALAQSWAKECENTGPVVKIMTPPRHANRHACPLFPRGRSQRPKRAKCSCRDAVARVPCQLVSFEQQRLARTCLLLYVLGEEQIF
jgi:NAD(P)-dependent dehydrogenase (short-subunit alcohol dehydrogenase family)